MSIIIREHVSLSEYTTFRIGGPARFFCEATNETELVEAIECARRMCEGSFFILGGGSNVLVDDAGFDGLVILMGIKGIDVHGVQDVQVTVGAGENWDDFVGQCVSRGLCGLENLSGIPGTVGAAPVQNIGAYGVEVAQFIQSVRVFDTSENVWKNMSAPECGFEYRDSIFKREVKEKKGEHGWCGGRYIITSVVFHLKHFIPGNVEMLDMSYKDLKDFQGHVLKSPADIRAAVLEIRSKKLPDVYNSNPARIGTAGSFFKNPIISAEHYLTLKKQYPDMPSFSVARDFTENKSVKIPLAWILDHVCGYKGVKKGNVGTYQNQALVIVNNGGATAADIKTFANEITATVKEKTGIDIEPEVQYV
jgi:UDP-N-acetylmuramate dehydrogenase